MQVFSREITWSQDLRHESRPISRMAVEFTVDKPSHMFVSGHIDTQHRGLIKAGVMVAFMLQLNSRWLKGSKTGENIMSRKHHYYSAIIHGYALVPPGTHRIELWGRSSSSASNKPGLAEVKPNVYNQMVVRVEDAIP